MISLKTMGRLFLMISLLISSWALAISNELKAVVDWETQANAVALRSNAEIKIQHYEIPLNLLNFDIDNAIAPGTRDSLVFVKDGQKYVRWIINPEDTKWHLEVEKFLKNSGASTKKYSFFKAYQTASRSYILVNPETGAEFSAKVSTNITGGNWTDKKQTYEDATQIRMIMKHIKAQIQKTGELKRSILLEEPAIFGIKSINQAMVIRAYDHLAGSGHRYVPGFSILHEKAGRILAQKNGSSDPASFWNEHYNKPLARALAEFILTTGVSYDSPHSQNFMVEIDANDKPTGRIVLRDFGDSFLAKQFFDALGKSFITAKWETKNVIDGKLSAKIAVMHGNKAPTWLTTEFNFHGNSSYDQWGRDFYEVFEKEIKLQTGMNLDSAGVTRNKLYFRNAYNLVSESGLKFLDLVAKGLHRENLKTAFCQNIFAQ